MENKLSLNRNAIKIVALTLMLIDHLAFALEKILPIWIYYLLRAMGRISFPLFAYFISEGFYYTKNKLKYFKSIENMLKYIWKWIWKINI